MKQLGKLEKIEDLRSIWKHEAKHNVPDPLCMQVKFSFIDQSNKSK